MKVTSSRRRPSADGPAARIHGKSECFTHLEAILHCRRLTKFTDLEGHAADWFRLHAQADQREIFQHFAWVQCWWESLGKCARLFTPIGYRQNRVVAILPLVLAGRQLRFRAYSASDYNHFLAESGEARAALPLCLDALLAQRTEWDSILLENVPESSMLDDCMRDLPNRLRRWVVRTTSAPCPTLLLDTNRRATLDSLLSRESLKRPVRRFKRQASLVLRHLEERDEALSNLDELMKQHIRRSVMAGRRSTFLVDAYALFYRKLVTRLDLRSELRFSVLTLDGRPIAYHFGMLSDSKYPWYKPAFDIDLWESSPGQVHLWFLIEHLQTISAREFDFGLGDEAFKFRFSNLTRQNLHISILPPGVGSMLHKVVWTTMASARNKIKESTCLYKFARHVYDLWREKRADFKIKSLGSAVPRLFGDMVYRREVAWLVSFDVAKGRPELESRVALARATLGDLADLALIYPVRLTVAKLSDARKRMREAMTPWIARIDGSTCMILWTAIDRNLHLPNRVVALPD